MDLVLFLYQTNRKLLFYLFIYLLGGRGGGVVEHVLFYFG